MTKLEERIRSGLHATAERIPDSTPDLVANQTEHRRPRGAWLVAAAALAVMVLAVPLVILGRSERGAAPGGSLPAPHDDGAPAVAGLVFTDPEHVNLRFTQDLTLVCEGLDTVDNGGFDSFTMEIWIDHRAGFTRLGIQYPNGETHDLILEGRPDAWERAWGRGTDLGRSAGCGRGLDDGGYEQTIAGWAFQDASELWFTAYLKPVSSLAGADVLVYHQGVPTRATAVAANVYEIEPLLPGGNRIHYEFTLDDAGMRVIGERRLAFHPDEFEATATIEVVESGPAAMPPGIFDTTEFTPLWGNGSSPVTTVGTDP